MFRLQTNEKKMKKRKKNQVQKNRTGCVLFLLLSVKDMSIEIVVMQFFFGSGARSDDHPMLRLGLEGAVAPRHIGSVYLVRCICH
jgi:hypothetical protein